MKWILWIFLALAAVLILITLIGYALPTQHTAAREAVFHQPPEAVWKVITDIDGMPSWRQGLKSVKHLPDHNGLPAWVENYDSGSLPYQTLTVLPPVKLVVQIAGSKLPFGGTWTYEITQVPEGSRLHIREDGEIYNPIFRFMSRFVLGYTATMDTYLGSLAEKFGEPAPAGN